MLDIFLRALNVLQEVKICKFMYMMYSSSRVPIFCQNLCHLKFGCCIIVAGHESAECVDIIICASVVRHTGGSKQ